MATTELLIGQIEEVKNQALKRLVVEEKPAEETKPDAPPLGQAEDDGERIYLICDQQDEESIEPLEDFLYDAGYEVKIPQFDGDEDAFVQAHQDNLKFCDGVDLLWRMQRPMGGHETDGSAQGSRLRPRQAAHSQGRVRWPAGEPAEIEVSDSHSGCNSGWRIK